MTPGFYRPTDTHHQYQKNFKRKDVLVLFVVSVFVLVTKTQSQLGFPNLHRSEPMPFRSIPCILHPETVPHVDQAEGKAHSPTILQVDDALHLRRHLRFARVE